MKKLLGLLAVAPLSLAACGDVKAEPIVEKDTVVEVHEDKDHLLSIYKVQNYVASGDVVRAYLNYYIEVKDGVDLSDWEFDLTIKQAGSYSMRPFGIHTQEDEDGNVIADNYEFGTDIYTTKEVQFQVLLTITDPAAHGLVPDDIAAYHADEERNAERIEALTHINASSTAAEKAAIYHKYAYPSTSDQSTVESLFDTLELHGHEAGKTEVSTTDLKIITDSE